MFGILAGLILCGFDSAYGEFAPNILMILADDMGWGDTTYNNGTAHTPFLDLWSQSHNVFKFNRGYSGGSVCSPTRACILTGRTPDRECILSAEGCGSEPAQL